MTIINNNVLKIHEINKIKIDLKNQSIAITNVLYVFDFDANLLFFSVLNKKDFSIMFYKKKLKCEKKLFWSSQKLLKKNVFFTYD